jgi:uroporphyrinogen-III synthase
MTHLNGLRILLTRASEDNRRLRRSLEEAGADVLELPAVAIAPPDDLGPLEEAVEHLDRFDWIVFTRRNAVRAVLERRAGAPFPSNLHVAAIGPSTARLLRDRGISVDLVPAQADGAGLAAALLGTGVAGRRVLVPQGDLGRSELLEALAAAGAMVEVVTVYRTIRPEVDADALAAVRQARIDAVVLASPSALHNLAKILGANRELLERATLVCIGQTTGEAALSAGFRRVSVAASPTDGALIEALASILECSPPPLDG